MFHDADATNVNQEMIEGLKEMPIKRVSLITNNDDYIDIDVPFSAGRTKEITKVIQNALTSPKGIKIIQQSENDKITTLNGIKQRIKRQGITHNEYIGFLIDNGIINEISDSIMSSFKGYFLSKHFSMEPYHLVNNEISNAAVLDTGNIGKQDFGNIKGISLSKIPLKSRDALRYSLHDKEGTDYYELTIDFDKIITEHALNSHKESDFDRFIVYQLNFINHKPHAVPIDLSFDGIQSAVINAIINYMYKGRSFHDSIYFDNVFQIEQIKSLLQNRSLIQMIFGCEDARIDTISSVQASKNDFDALDRLENENWKSIATRPDDFDGLLEFNDLMYSLYNGFYCMDFDREKSYPNNNKITFRVRLDPNQIKDNILDIFNRIDSIAYKSIYELHTLQGSISFDDSNGVLEESLSGWKSVETLCQIIIDYINNNQFKY